MSLKAFHFLFIVLATILSIVCSLLGWMAYRGNPETAALAFGGGFAVLAVAMTFYGFWFFKKSKNIIV